MTSLVVGGSGFLGRTIVDMLLERGEQVRVFDLNPHPDEHVEMVVGDLLNPDHVHEAVQGVETIYQTASFIGWKPADDTMIEAINVQGNRHVLQAAQAAGVRRFVYTSSIDVLAGGQAIRDGDESIPYPSTFLNAYSRTKAQAEQEVLAANDPDGLLTVAIRAAGIFGPGDRVRLPSVIQAAREGNNMQIGSGDAVFNHVYVDNIAYAHLLAADALEPGSPPAGEAYFITDDEATNFFDFVGYFLTELGYEAPKRSLSQPVAQTIATVSEAWSRLTNSPALLTRYIVFSTANDFSFVHDKATRDFGYQPIVSRDEALQRTLAWLREQGYGA